MPLPERSVVTGAAGFIGSHLCERLVAEGVAVVGVDSFTDYYDPQLKRANLAGLSREPRFTLVEGDLNQLDLGRLLAGAGAVFHQAGQPGVRASWGESFAPYVERNVLATQRLLEAARASDALDRFVYASSSSVYGDAPQLPAAEDTLPQPVSPYGVTKLAGEHLAVLYEQLGVPTVALRYFTVYGPRQRPDMAFNRFIRAMLSSGPILLNGDGEQSRDFTFVADIVEGNLAAATAPRDRVGGRVYNLGGGSRVTVNHVVGLLASILGVQAHVEHRPAPPGEARHTFADTEAARRDLGWTPSCGLAAGLRAEAEWIRGELGA